MAAAVAMELPNSYDTTLPSLFVNGTFFPGSKNFTLSVSTQPYLPALLFDICMPWESFLGI